MNFSIDFHWTRILYTVFMLTNSDRFCALYFVTKGDFFGETVGIFVHLLDKLGLDREAQLYSWKSEYWKRTWLFSMVSVPTTSLSRWVEKGIKSQIILWAFVTNSAIVFYRTIYKNLDQINILATWQRTTLESWRGHPRNRSRYRRTLFVKGDIK